MSTTDTPTSRRFTATKDDGSKITIQVRRPTQRELELSDFELSRVFNQALLNQLPPRSRLLRKMRANGIWTDADSEAMDTLRGAVARADSGLADLNKQIEPLEKIHPAPENLADLLAKRDALVLSRNTQFGDLRELRTEVDGMLGHTADAKAESAQRNFLICCVTEYVGGDKADEVGDRVFSSVEDLLISTDINLVQRIIYEYITFNADLPSEYVDEGKAPEATPPADSAVKVDSPAQPGEGAQAAASAAPDTV